MIKKLNFLYFEIKNLIKLKFLNYIIEKNKFIFGCF